MSKDKAILRFPEVIKRTGLSRGTIYLRLRNDDFPKPVSLGGRSVGWIESDITDWIEQKVEERDKADATS